MNNSSLQKYKEDYHYSNKTMIRNWQNELQRMAKIYYPDAALLPPSEKEAVILATYYKIAEDFENYEQNCVDFKFYKMKKDYIWRRRYEEVRKNRK